MRNKTLLYRKQRETKTQKEILIKATYLQQHLEKKEKLRLSNIGNEKRNKKHMLQDCWQF